MNAGAVYKNDVELHDVILHIADDLYRGEVTKMRISLDNMKQ